MRNQNGITLISLVITIILMLILASVGIYTGLESYENMRVQVFVAKMITIQEAVDKLCEEYSVAEINGKGHAYNLASNEEQNLLTELINNSSDLKSWYSTVDNNVNNYRYFNIDDISKILGIKNFDTPIWFNPTSRNVIATKGIEYNNKMYYRQYDLSGGQTLPTPNINVSFALSYSVHTYDNKAEIVLLKDETETVFSQVKYYKQKEETGEYGDAQILNMVSKIPLTESGVYKVEATDSTGNTQSQEGIIITIVNKPLLVDGMTPIKYAADGTFTTTTYDDKSWYNYGENVKNWANVQLKDGSVYVWIPRFAYLIDTKNDSDNSNNIINIKFLKQYSQVGTDGKAIATEYKVAPAFQDGTENGFTNGEWDEHITGFWIAKYETTKAVETITTENTVTNADGTTTTTQSTITKEKPKNVLLQEECWRNITPNEAFNLCRKMEADYLSTYFSTSVGAASGTYKNGVYANDNNNIDVHLVKNSEWGATAYLSHSKYGAGAANITAVSSYYVQENSGVNFSSTGNYSGVYGMSGGAYDMVAAGITFAYTDSNGDAQTCYNSENNSTKYATYYSSSDIVGDKNKVFGDAMKETSGWNSNLASTTLTQLISRGGWYSIASGNGIFAYENKNYDAEETATFRPVLIVEY